MSITLAVSGRPAVSMTREEIILGSDFDCGVSFSEVDGVQANHAVIRLIEGRWRIDAFAGCVFHVGNSGPQRSHWLVPGDRIRLTENCPAMVFQPYEDDSPLPSLATDTAPDTAHEINRVDTVPFLPVTPASSPSIRARASSAEVPVPKSQSSGSVPVSKSASSASIRAPKSRTSTSIPTSKSSASGTMRTTSGEAAGATSKARRSDGSMRAAGNSLAKSSDQIIIPDDDSDQPAQVPVLKRMSSYDEDELLDLPPSRRSKDQDEMQWVLSVVGKIVGAGVAILVLLIVVNALRKSFTPAPFEPSPTGSAAVSTEVIG